MKVLFSVGLTIWLVACASSPDAIERKEIEGHYKDTHRFLVI